MLKFHLGAFLSDLPRQPAAIRYGLYGTARSTAEIAFVHHSLWQILVFRVIPSIPVDINFLDRITVKTFGNDPRTFGDAVALKTANYQGVRLIHRRSSEIYKPDENKQKNE
jgi:hypothetical protein